MRERSRRRILFLGGATLAGLSALGLGSDQVDDSGLTIQGIYVEGESFADENIERVEDALDFVDAEFEEEYVIGEEEFYERYSRDGVVWEEDVLGDEDSFWADYTEPELKDEEIQVMFVPGSRNSSEPVIESKDHEPHSKEIAVVDEPSLGERVAVSAPSYESPENSHRKAKYVLHGIGHALGLEHSDDQSNIMYEDIHEDMEFSLTQEQKQEVQRNLPPEYT